jgi:putative acetyltransferase
MTRYFITTQELQGVDEQIICFKTGLYVNGEKSVIFAICQGTQLLNAICNITFQPYVCNMNSPEISKPAQIALKRKDSNSPEFRHLIKLLDENLVEINGDIQADYDQHNVIEYIETVVVAYADGVAAGCGCFKEFDADTIEVKRMYVDKPFRQKGVAFKVLSELEAWAKELGYIYTVLETGKRHHEAIGLYEKVGYIITENYEPYIDMPDSVCMRKGL